MKTGFVVTRAIYQFALLSSALRRVSFSAICVPFYAFVLDSGRENALLVLWMEERVAGRSRHGGWLGFELFGDGDGRVAL